jgi:hypothetical protein
MDIHGEDIPEKVKQSRQIQGMPPGKFGLS